MSTPRMFSVSITFDADEGPEVADALAGVLRHDGPFLAPGPVTIRHDNGRVSVEFLAVSDDPAAGPTSVGQSVPGAEVVAALEGFSHEHSAAVPILRALLTVTAAREIAGLQPRRELHIGVQLAQTIPQDALSSHRSESVHMPARIES